MLRDDHQERNQQEHRAHETRKRPSHNAQRVVIFGMADSIGLKQRPKAMAYMDEKETNTCSVNKGKEGVVQNLGDEIRNRLNLGFFNKMKIGKVDQDEYKNCNTGVGHGFGAQGAAAGAGFNSVFAASCLAVFKEKDNSGDNVQEKDGIQTDFKDRYKNA